tara:strand:+ start:21403 stop:21966 length:564 start_codon:yes stop_codon:yes gene_type:complete
MWKAQLRSKTNTAQIDLDIRPTPKRKDRKCREEFMAMKGKIETNLQQIRMKSYLYEEFTDDYAFNITGLPKYFKDNIENIPDEFFCKVLDAIKQIDTFNNYNNPVTFEYQHTDIETGEVKDDTFYAFYGISYEPNLGLQYYNYSAIYLMIRTNMNSSDNLIYMDLGFKGRDGFSYVPAPNFDTWKWW